MHWNDGKWKNRTWNYPNKRGRDRPNSVPDNRSERWHDKSFIDLSLEEIKTIDIHPRKTNISLEFVGLIWVPQWITEENGALSAF